MNWKRIKTILICALIAINLLLGFTIYENIKIENSTAEVGRVQILNLFSQKNILMPEDIFEVNLEIANLEVKISSYDLEKMETVFDVYKTNTVTNRKLEIIENELTFTTKYEVLDATFLSDEILLENAHKLVKELGFSVEDVHLNEIGRTGKKTIFSFSQIINDSIITDSNMIISFNNENLIGFKRLWYDVLSTSKTDKNFCSPEYALYTFLGLEYDRFPNRKKDVSIQSIKLVYRLNSGTDDNNSGKKVVEGDAGIYWEIKASNDSEPYYVYAIKD